jgi:hypothetical protein
MSRSMGTPRFLLFHGAIQLLISMLTGILLVARVPPARAWMGFHVTVMLVGILLIVTGLVWPQLSLGPKSSAALKWIPVLNGYLGVVAGGAATALGLLGPVSAGNAVQDEKLLMLFGPGFALLGLSGISWAGLLVYGLRGKAPS